ncbi:MAG: hypothetical protein OEY14_07455 [Myxococcales bacterium]|nr:hypothetical protein [Myxococcales bacterium]
MRKRPQGEWSRIPAPWKVALASLCLVAQLAGATHLVIVRHIRCAEHGEWLHEGEAPHAARAESAEGVTTAERDAEGTPDAGPALGLGDVASHEHEPCPCLTERRRLALRIGGTPKAHVHGLARATLTLGDEAPPALAATYALAPKCSPPV